MVIARVPWLPVVVCLLLAAAPTAVVAQAPASASASAPTAAVLLDPAPRNVAAPGEKEATSDTVKWAFKIPPSRSRHSMAYDSARGRVVLFGGYGGSVLADTLEWDGNAWAQRAPSTSPPAREGHAMAYDSARGRVVLFGGESFPALEYADTWEWDGNTWAVRASAGATPRERIGHAMAYDSARGRVVLFGGYYFLESTAF